MSRMENGLDRVALAVVYAGWADDQRLLIASIGALDHAQLALRAAPHLRDIGHVVGHIVAARARMIHWILGAGGDALDSLAMWDGFDQPAPSQSRPGDELVHGLEMTGQAIQDALATWTVDDLDQRVEWQYGGVTYPYSRQQVIWKLVRHDYHHYGEVALTLGMHGLPTPDF